MINITGIVVVTVGCAMIFGIVYLGITARNRETMAMIEAGMDPKTRREEKHSKLRLAMLAFFVPIGILIGNSTHDFFNMDSSPAAVVFAFLFGGIALVATYFIEWALKEHDEEKENGHDD